MNGRRSGGARRWLHLALAVWLILGLGGSHRGQAATRPPDNLLPHRVWLPLLTQELRAYRLGFGVTAHGLDYPASAPLQQAGWHLTWWVNSAPRQPNGLEYVQVVRLHQNLTCPLNAADAWDRVRCPYVVPYSYSFWPSAASITQAARANPGALWLLGNEMDRRDWPGGSQDELLPEVYAVAYHDLYQLIKDADPTARLANGALIQATPLRLAYLSRVWEAYQQRYGSPMPVDVWNVHNFILQERRCCHGAGIPPGSAAEDGVVYRDSQHVDLGVFDQQIRAFRRWLQAHGQQDKPLIVSEYGVLYWHIAEADTAEEVQDFMVRTFDYFLQARDCSLGYAADDCRLVQRWLWYSLDDTGQASGFNRYGALFDPQTQRLTATGERFREYLVAHMAELAR